MLTFLVIGLIQGAVFGLIALGLALVYKGARVFNFAQAEFGTVAMFISWIVIVRLGLPYPVGVVAALAVALLLGLVVERIVIRPLFNAPRVTVLVAVAGVALLLIAIELILGEAQGRDLPPAIAGEGVRLFGVAISPQQIFILLALVATSGALAYFFSRTNTGLAILAMAQEPTATRICGIPIKRMSTIVWGLAALLGGLAGVLQGPLFPFFPGEMTTVALLPGFTAAVLGGITSLWGSLAGGFIVGAIQGLGQFYIGETIPGGGNLVVFIVLLAVLLFRPGGLFGRAPSQTEEAGQGVVQPASRFVPLDLDRRAWIFRRGLLAAILLAVLIVPRLLPSFRSDQISLAIIFAMIGLSIHVIMAYTGQISLGHQAFVGIGAFASANLVSRLGYSFWIAIVVAALTGAIAAGALGVVALRLRGLYLALITLAYGSVAEESIFGIRELTRGGAGVDAPRPAGFDSDYAFTYLCFAFLVLILFVDWRFVKSKAGRAVLAIRQNEMVAASYGVDVTRYKVFAFVLSGIYAGIAGSLFAHWNRQVVANVFEFDRALTWVLMTVVGGLGSRVGVIIASAFFALFPLIFNALTVWVPAVGAMLLIVTLALHPGGLGEQLEPIIEYFRGRAPARAAIAQTLVVFALLCMIGVLLSALVADAVWIALAMGLAGLLFVFRKRPAARWGRAAMYVGMVVFGGGALVMCAVWSVWLPIVFAVPVPFLLKVALSLAAGLHAAPHGPPTPAEEEPELVGAGAPTDGES